MDLDGKLRETPRIALELHIRYCRLRSDTSNRGTRHRTSVEMSMEDLKHPETLHKNSHLKAEII